MPNVFIIHGTEGHPGENWIPWLKGELEKIGCRVFVPAFPTPEGQSLESWLEAFRPYESELDAESIVIGHSLGPVFLLTLLEKHSVKAFFSIAGFLGEIGNPHFDALNKTFMRELDWSRIQAHCPYFEVIQGDNDPYVPIQKAHELAQKLGVQAELIPNGGHLNTAAGYTKFPQLLEKLKAVLGKRTT